MGWNNLRLGLLSWTAAALCLAAADAWCVRVDAYPDAPPGSLTDAEEIITQVWYVNHFRAVRNFAITRNGDTMPFLVYRNRGGKFRFRSLERMLKNDFPPDSGILAKDIAIFYYPMAVRGTGILITDFIDPERSQQVQVWLPALRKVRRFPEPSHDDAYAGSDWTFGDVSLRKPRHETHVLLRIETFDEADQGGGTLHVVQVPAKKRLPFALYTPKASSEFAGRRCYVVKSTTKFPEFWYDYRVSWVDTITFADYRILYYKDGELVKVIDKHWKPMRGHPPSPDMDDPRALYWTMWYGKNMKTGHETMAVIPPRVSKWNAPIPGSTWTEAYLRRLRR